MPTTPVSPKVTAAAGGGGLGVAVATILVWILTANGVEVPEPAATAIGAVISAALAAGAGYLRRDPMRSAYEPKHDDNLRA